MRISGAGDSRRELERRLRARFARDRRSAAGADYRLRIERPADAAGVAPIEREARLHAEPNAELAAELVVGDDDAAFDDDLPHGDVDLANQPADFFEPAAGILHEQDIGSRVDHRGAALGQELALLVRDQRLDRIGLLVVELEHLGLQRLQVVDLLHRLELLLFLDGELLTRRDQNDVAVLAHVQALGLHDDVERLVPWNVLEPQRQAAGDRVAGDDVETGEVGDHLQHGAHFDVLEVERKLLALVARARSLGEPIRVFLDRLDLDDEAIVGLVGRVLPEPLGLDHHPRVAGLLECIDRHHRRGEVADIEPALEIARQRGLDGVDDQRLALLPDVDAGRGIRQIDDDPSFAVTPATKVDVAQRMRGLAWACLGEAGYRRRLRGNGRRFAQRDHDRIAFDLGFERLGLVQIENDARAIACLDDIDAAQRRITDFLRRATHAVAGVGKIKRDPRRIVDREAGRWIGQWRLQREPDDRAARASLGDREVLDAVRGLRQCLTDIEQKQRRNGGNGDCLQPMLAFRFCGSRGSHLRRSCLVSASASWSLLVRSVQSPAPSCTSSLS